MANERWPVSYTHLADRLARLAELTKEDPDCVLLMQQLKTLTSAKLNELALTIQKRRDAGLEAALAIVNTDEGNDQMDAIRTVAAEIDRKVRGRQALSEDKYGASVVRTELDVYKRQVDGRRRFDAARGAVAADWNQAHRTAAARSQHCLLYTSRCV